MRLTHQQVMTVFLVSKISQKVPYDKIDDGRGGESPEAVKAQKIYRTHLVSFLELVILSSDRQLL